MLHKQDTILFLINISSYLIFVIGYTFKKMTATKFLASLDFIETCHSAIKGWIPCLLLLTLDGNKIVEVTLCWPSLVIKDT